MKGHSPILQSLAVAVAAFATIVVVLLFIPRYVADYQEPGGNGPNWRMEETRPTGPSFSARPDPECDVPEIYRQALRAALAVQPPPVNVKKIREEAFRAGWEEGYRLGREDWRRR